MAYAAEPSGAPFVSDTERIRDMVLTKLLEKGDGFISGTALSQLTGVTRTAIWKQLRTLEDVGFKFVSVHGRGYRLLSAPDVLFEPLLRRHLASGQSLGRVVRWYSSVDSTNIVASKLAQAGALHGTIVTARTQAGGRGRRGRRWFSPPEGLWFSLILQRPFPLARAGELTLLTSVAVRRAILRQVKLPITIKWPNDLLCDGRKVCGILAEIRADGESVQHAVLGIGINANIEAGQFPEELTSIATSLMAEADMQINRVKLTADILDELEPLYEALTLDRPSFALVRQEWREASSTLGRAVRVQTPLGLIEGHAERIDDAGVLYVRQAHGTVAPIHSGDVLF